MVNDSIRHLNLDALLYITCYDFSLFEKIQMTNLKAIYCPPSGCPIWMRGLILRKRILRNQTPTLKTRSPDYSRNMIKQEFGTLDPALVREDKHENAF